MRGEWRRPSLNQTKTATYCAGLKFCYCSACKMKFKLMVHQQNFSEENLVINPRDYNGLQVGDIVEIYHPEDTFSRLLLQVKKLSTDFQQKDTISIEQSIASTFQLRAYLDVYLNRIEPSDVTLDLVEIIFKDQYMSRSDLWRLQRSLVDSCVYMGNKLMFAGLRLQVYEMWMNGEKLACGMIGKDTKVVFRSQSAQIHIFIQMSAEMWEFDFFGDLYFEKTVNGFLKELFVKWKESNCNHEVTIVMYSRTYYSAKLLDDFPQEMRSSVAKGVDGRFHQDFYKAIANSEPVSDWKQIAMLLKTNFNDYLSWVGCDGVVKDQPVGTNSISSDGNVLEALNISLNIFETFYIDANLERTNSTVILITPGSGVFDVDRELTGMTKQRLMDGGFGVDLVCLAEQPLHAVPLLKFHSKKQQRLKDTHVIQIDYNIPQWINHSFYRSPEQRNAKSRFIPRMKVPERPILPDEAEDEYQDLNGKQVPPYLQSGLDFDDYDAQVFTYTTPRTLLQNRLAKATQNKRKADLGLMRKSSPDMIRKHGSEFKRQGSWNESQNASPRHPVRALSECEDIRLSTSVGENMIFIDDDTFGESDSSPDMDAVFKRNLIGGFSANQENYPLYQGGFINPFKPYHLSYKLTLFRHMWLHTFPTDPRGEAMQEHHRKILLDQDGITPTGTSFEQEETTISIIDGHKSTEHLSPHESLRVGSDRKHGEHFDGSDMQRVRSIKKVGSDKSIGSGGYSAFNIFHKPQDQDWTATILTGVDWKSLSIPACLPMTTDYFPDQKTFENDFYWYNYAVIIDDSYVRPVSDETCHDRFKMTAKDKFLEAVSQRIAQGFQFVKNRDRLKFLVSPNKGSRPLVFQRLDEQVKEEYVLSHVQQIHHIQFDGQELSVNKYVKKHVPTTKPIEYKYKLWPIDNSEFQGRCTSFAHDDTINYNWNYLDHYVTGEGEDCNTLLEDMKYWRMRFLLLPRKDNSDEGTKYSGDTKMIEIEGFLKFMEGLNGIKRPINQRMLFICRRHTAEDQKAYMERRETVTEDRKKRERPESDATSKGKTTPNGTQKKSTPSKESPIDVREKRHRRKPSAASGDIVDDQKGGSAERPAEKHAEKPSEKPTERPAEKPTERPAPNSEENTEDKYAIPSKMPPKHALKATSPLEDIVKAMQNPEYGLSFLPEQAGLRNSTFISAEAVAWMIKSIDGIDSKTEAVQLGQRMLDANLIMHASQSEAQCFVDGMFLFFVKSTEKADDKSEKSRKISLFTSFGTKRTEEELLMNYNIKWFEVEVWRGKPADEIPEYLKTDIVSESPVKSPISPNREKRSRAASETPPGKPVYKSMDYSLDSNRRSDRAEWCTIYYHDNYCPDQAFSLELHWMVSTASIISERVQHWARRAIGCGFHLVPAPVQPLPIHCSIDSLACKKRPLSKPNFIHLDIECLLEQGQEHIFEDFEKSTWNRRIVLFQEAILMRFGFLRDFPRASNSYGLSFNQKREAHSNQFVHWTGSVFVRIVDQPIELKLQTSPSVRKINFEDKTEDELETYKDSSKRLHLKVDTLLSDLGTDLNEEKFPTGFFWTPNYSLTKKSRSSYTGDATSTNKLMEDLSNFCANKDGLLSDFWQRHNLKKEEKSDYDQEVELSPDT